MGCHTWTYRKLNRSLEEARILWIATQEKWVEEWKEIVANPQDRFRVAQKMTQEYADHCLKVFERQLRMVKTGLCNVAVMNKQSEHCEFIPGRGLYIEDDEMPHDIFRIGGYPDDRLFSLQDCLSFIEKNKDKVYRGDIHCGNSDESHKINHESVKKQLEEFWTKYPEGMIQFG